MSNQTTEQTSNYDELENMSTKKILDCINNEDKNVALVLQKAIPQIETFVNQAVDKMKHGGRLFYIGAGTSGRLGVLDASECPPTFGVTDDYIIGIIAGGDTALRKAVEYAEDDTTMAWKDLSKYSITKDDVVLGIAASGNTPYVVGGVVDAKINGLLTGCIVCNEISKLSQTADLPITLVVGPEFITASTRMKAGTAQKLALNMISTSIMIKLGRVKGNKMVDMQLTNNKLIKRGALMVMETMNVNEQMAIELLKKYGSVRKVIEITNNNNNNII